MPKGKPEERVLDEYRTAHLQYELDMLAGTYKLLKGDHEQIIAYALIESFCIHARNLIDFYRSSDKNDFVKAKHFTKDGTYKPQFVGDPDGEIGRVLYSKLNQQIAHMTKDRTTDEREKVGPEDRERIFEALRKEEARFRGVMIPATPDTIRTPSSDRSATNTITTSSLEVLGQKSAG